MKRTYTINLTLLGILVTCLGLLKLQPATISAFTAWPFDKTHAPIVQKSPFLVLEIFTSEGCNQCPPAYPVIKKVYADATKEYSKTLLLDFHVDYWNDGGWIDPFSSSDYTKRQMAYSRKFPGTGLYTPQLIINGQNEAVASDEGDLQTKLQTPAVPTTVANIEVTPHKTGNMVQIDFNAANYPTNAIINFAIVQKEVTSKVTAGENAGMTLTHYNVVRKFKTYNLSRSNGTIQVDISDLPVTKYDVVAYIQNRSNLQVLAADGKPLQ